MKVLDDLIVDGSVRINNPYDLYADSIYGTGSIRLSAQVYSGPTLILENALDLANADTGYQSESAGAGIVAFRRRFGDAIPLDKDRAGTISFTGWSGAADAQVLRPAPDPRTGAIYYSNWNTCAAIWAEFIGTPSLVTTGEPKGPKMPGDLVFGTNSGIAGRNPSERMRITKEGNIGLGISTPEQRLHIGGNILFQNSNNGIYGKNSSGVIDACLLPRRTNNNTLLRYGTGGLTIESNNGLDALTIDDNRVIKINNNLNIGGVTPSDEYSLYTRRAIRTQEFIYSNLWVETPKVYIGGLNNFNNPVIEKTGNNLEISTVANNGEISFWTQFVNQRMVIKSNGRVGINTTNPNATLQVNGTIAKNAGTFLIDHPLDPANKNLYHGFVEAPRYDLIYRGTIKLTAGQATVDIDIASNMTKGTFAALTQNAEVVALVNKTSYSRLKSSDVTDGEFVINCEDEFSNDTVSWVVIAERHDPFIINNDSTRTDENGHLIPEWEKPPL